MIAVEAPSVTEGSTVMGISQMGRWIRMRGTARSAALALVVGAASWAVSPALAAGIPQHMVTFLAGPGQTECPDNWTEAAYAQGRLILGTTDGSSVQKMAGTPAGDAQPPQHNHAFKVTGTVDSTSNSSLPIAGVARAAGGEVTSTGTTDNASIPLPFIQFLACEQMADESPDSTPYGTVAFFNAQSCPEGWATLGQADGRFLLPATAGIKPGYATATSWDPQNPPTHTHQLKASFETSSSEYEAFPSNWVEFASPGKYTVAGTAAANGPVLPFVSLLVCEKDGIGNSDGIPTGISIFYGGENCPDTWGATIGADGRFVVGIGGNGTQGATFGSAPIVPGETSVQHDHAFSGLVDLPASSSPGNSTVPNRGRQSYVTTAGNGFSGTSSETEIQLPYLVLQSCTKQ